MLIQENVFEGIKFGVMDFEQEIISRNRKTFLENPGKVSLSKQLSRSSDYLLVNSI